MSFSQFEQATPKPDPAPKAMGHDFRLNKTKDRIPPKDKIIIFQPGVNISQNPGRFIPEQFLELRYFSEKF